MSHLEDKGRVKYTIECHSLTETAGESGPAVPGQEVPSYQVKPSEDCLFLPKALPPKSKPSKGSAASAMDFSQWDFQKCTHNLGGVKMVVAMNFDEGANTIIPVKPVVYLTEPINMEKGDFILLG